MGMFEDPRRFGFVPGLEAACGSIRAELATLDRRDFTPSPDSLTTVTPPYDETGWRAFDLFGDGVCTPNRERFPATVGACASVPGLVNASFSLLEPGTHLYPHRGELEGVLRCHLGLEVPDGDCALRGGGETRRWRSGRCLIFDDTLEHEAWNRTNRDRVVLLITFARPVD